MTTTYHPGALRVDSKPDDDMVQFTWPMMGTYSIEKAVLQSIVAQHTDER